VYDILSMLEVRYDVACTACAAIVDIKVYESVFSTFVPSHMISAATAGYDVAAAGTNEPVVAIRPGDVVGIVCPRHVFEILGPDLEFAQIDHPVEIDCQAVLWHPAVRYGKIQRIFAATSVDATQAARRIPETIDIEDAVISPTHVDLIV